MENRVVEICLYMLGIGGEGVHEGFGMALEFLLVFHHRLRAEGAFQVMVEVFVGIVLRRVGRKVKQGDFVRPLLHPLTNLFAVVHPQIVQDQKNLAARIVNQASHETNQPVRVDRLGIQQKMHLAA